MTNLQKHGLADLRSEFALVCPIQVILLVCGLPADAETHMRRWYDSFEAALANFTAMTTYARPRDAASPEFHALLDTAIDSVTHADDSCWHNWLTRRRTNGSMMMKSSEICPSILRRHIHG